MSNLDRASVALTHSKSFSADRSESQLYTMQAIAYALIDIAESLEEIRYLYVNGRP